MVPGIKTLLCNNKDANLQRALDTSTMRDMVLASMEKRKDAAFQRGDDMKALAVDEAIQIAETIQGLAETLSTLQNQNEIEHHDGLQHLEETLHQSLKNLNTSIDASAKGDLRRSLLQATHSIRMSKEGLRYCSPSELMADGKTPRRSNTIEKGAIYDTTPRHSNRTSLATLHKKQLESLPQQSPQYLQRLRHNKNVIRTGSNTTRGNDATHSNSGRTKKISSSSLSDHQAAPVNPAILQETAFAAAVRLSGAESLQDTLQKTIASLTSTQQRDKNTGCQHDPLVQNLQQRLRGMKKLSDNSKKSRHSLPAQFRGGIPREEQVERVPIDIPISKEKRNIFTEESIKGSKYKSCIHENYSQSQQSKATAISCYIRKTNAESKPFSGNVWSHPMGRDEKDSQTNNGTKKNGERKKMTIASLKTAATAVSSKDTHRNQKTSQIVSEPVSMRIFSSPILNVGNKKGFSTYKYPVSRLSLDHNLSVETVSQPTVTHFSAPLSTMSALSHSSGFLSNVDGKQLPFKYRSVKTDNEKGFEIFEVIPPPPPPPPPSLPKSDDRCDSDTFHERTHVRGVKEHSASRHHDPILLSQQSTTVNRPTAGAVNLRQFDKKHPSFVAPGDQNIPKKSSPSPLIKHSATINHACRPTTPGLPSWAGHSGQR